jgi:hypothetical protein
MKTVIAYALVIIGIPNLVGILFGALVQTPIIGLLSVSGKFRLTVLPYMEVFCGFGAVVAAILLFHFLGATLSIAIPILIAAWMSFYFWRYKQSPQAWCSWLVGIAVGWFTISRLIS